MLQFDFYLGLNDKDTKQEAYNFVEAESKINKLLLNIFNLDGVTYQYCKGCYKHENGEIVFENTLKITIFINIEELGVSICECFKILFNQECILYTKSKPIVNFI